MNKYKESQKLFLSSNPTEYGSVCWSVGCKDWIKPYPVEDGKIPNRWGDVRISDCNNSISLDFWYETEEGYQERLEKIEDLIRSLEDFKEAFIRMRKQELIIEVKKEEGEECLPSTSLRRIMDM